MFAVAKQAGMTLATLPSGIAMTPDRALYLCLFLAVAVAVIGNVL